MIQITPPTEPQAVGEATERLIEALEPACAEAATEDACPESSGDEDNA